MFQKLKDKIAEQSSLKLPVSVQQFTQAMSSSTSPNKLQNSEPFKEKDDEDMVNESSSVSDFNSDLDSSFTTIDLRSPPSSRNRRSSASSDLFPIYEFQPARHNLQSDLESNSEFDDGSSIHQFTNVSKENLYEKYKIMLQKYHKYRGRFVDMRKYCLEMEREHEKIKNVLTETQDKAIRRTKELKEQCSLEQTAKAHLEGVLRNELEERDLIISTLNTKIKLLKNGKDNISLEEPSKPILDFSRNQMGCDQVHFLNSFQEVQLMKDKIKNFELLLSKAKEAITTKNNQLKTLESRIESVKNELKASTKHIGQLQNKIDLMKHKEEEALLSLAENKMVVHRELEAKEKHIKILEDKLARYESETQKLRTKGETDALSTEKSASEEIRAKDAEIQSLRKELLQLKSANPALGETLIDLDLPNGAVTPDGEPSKVEELKLLLGAKDGEIAHLRVEVSSLRDELTEQSEIRDEISGLNRSLCQMRDALNEKEQQLKSHLETISRLRSEQATVNAKLVEASKYQKLHEEATTMAKADKIVADEVLKQAKNELAACQAELKTAKAAVEKHESEVKAHSQLLDEKLQLERELLEYKAIVAEANQSLERAKQGEHQMQLQTADFLEEINRLKAKEGEYAAEVGRCNEQLELSRKLEAEVERLNGLLEEEQQQSQRLVAENEAVKAENDGFRQRIDELHDSITQLERSLIAKKKSLEAEYKRLEADRLKGSTQAADLSMVAEEKAKLESGNAKLELENANLKSGNEKLESENANLMSENANLKSGNEKLESENANLMSENANLKSENMKMESENANLISENANLKSENGKLESENANLKSGNAELESVDANLMSENANLKSENTRLELENTNLMSENANLKSENGKLESENANLKSGNTTLELENTNFMSENANLKSENMKMEFENANLMSENANLKSENVILESENANLELENTNLISENGNLKSENVMLELENANLKSGNENLELKNTILQSENTNFESENTNLKSENTNLKSEITILELENKNLKSENAKLESENANLKLEKVNLASDLNKSAEENANLKSDISNMKTENENSKTESTKLTSESTNLISENASLKSENVNLKSENTNLKSENVNLKSENTNLKSENTNLKSENARIVKNNEEISEKMGKLFVENRSFREETELLREDKLAVQSQIVKFKDQCQISEDSDQPTILAAVFDKFLELAKATDELKTENETLKPRAAQTQALAAELESWRQKCELLSSECKKLQEELSEQSIKSKELLSQLAQTKEELLANEKVREENERVIVGLEQKLASATQASEPPAGEVATDCCTKIAVPDLQMVAEKVHSLPSSCRDAILLVRSQLLDLRARNEEVKTDLLHFRRLSTDSDEPGLARLANLLDECGTKNESVRQEVSLLRTQKEELLRKIQNLENEIEEVKVEATDNLHKRESFYKEKYSQEMMEIITGYEKRLAEKDNEYELLQNKMNLRNDRESTAMYQETKEVIQNLQEELTTRQDSYSELLVKHKKEVEELNEKLADLKEQYAKDLRENDKRWRSCLDKKMDEVEEKYKEEINELTKEWTIDRKPSSPSSEINSKDSEEFLEESAKNSEDSEALKKQVQILSNELNNCKRSHWREIDLNLMNTSYENAQHSNLTLEDCTEMEYLRNILYKYMMGHQPVVLAKVLAAVVKFDNQQTEEILLREEQKQTLMGHLGFS